MISLLGLMKRTALIAGSIVGIVALALAVVIYYPMLSLTADQLFVNEAAPENDAAAALARGRPRCYSVNGYARWFPGVESDNGKAFCTAHETNFRATSDVILGSWHKELQSRATAYARAYNSHVVRTSVERK
jgi:hypothetical protein